VDLLSTGDKCSTMSHSPAFKSFETVPFFVIWVLCCQRHVYLQLCGNTSLVSRLVPIHVWNEFACYEPIESYYCYKGRRRNLGG
jgi:hypothetical protein